MSFLDSVQFFKTLSSGDRQHLSYFCQKKTLQKWEELFHQWDEPNAFYVVISGSFAVEKEKDGIIQELWPVQAGDILWEMSLFGKEHARNATIVAKEDSELITILDFSIKELTNKNPDILEKIQKIIKQRSSQ